MGSETKLTPAAKAVLIVASLASFMGFLDATIVNIAFPTIEAAFPEASRADVSWVLNAYAIGFAALLVPAGRLADVIGRKKVFMVGLAIFTFASALCAFAPSIEALVGARLLQAAGAAAIAPTSIALILEATPPQLRATALGLWGAAAGVAAAVGPTLGGLLIEVGDWELIFLVNIPVGLLTLLLARRILVESTDPTATRLPDLLGAVLVAAAAGLLALGLVQGETWGWGSTATLATFAGAAVLVPVIVARSRNHAAPVIELRLLQTPQFVWANVATVTFAAAFFGVILANVLFLTTVWGWSVLTAGIAVTPSPIMAAVFAGPAGKLADRYGQRAVLVPGSIIFSAGVAWLAANAGAQPDYLTAWLPGAILAGIGIGLTFPTLASAGAASLAPVDFGVGSGILAMFRQIGAVLGVAIGIAILGVPAPGDAVAAFQHVWMFAIGCALLCAAASAMLGRVHVVDQTVPAVSPDAVAA